MKDYSYIANAHPAFIENLYRSWETNPASVEPDWQDFFKGFNYAIENGSSNGHSAASTNGTTSADSAQFSKELAVMALIQGYRDKGHFLSTTNPIKPRKDRQPRLDLSDYGLSEADLNTKFMVGSELKMPNATLAEIVQRLKTIYCGNIGFEDAHIYDKGIRMWLRQKIEGRNLSGDFGFSVDKKKRIFSKINEATTFEEFVHTKFIGTKRFSVEGGESVIAGIDAMINKASEGEVPAEEVIFGMAHRGRLTVLATILGKTKEQLFTEFEGTNETLINQSYGSGDVKYHLGYSSLVKTTSNREIYLKLLPNPSHLETVDPVVEGYARAKADKLYGGLYDRILPILIHGDAAVAGQGVVFETLQMSGLSAYKTGGTVHVVINNQIGFTTNWVDARTSTYSTSAATVVQSPVFHVNGDDPEAVVFVCELAVEFRQMFQRDVFIDMVCYRKYGHNESDEPRFTQPGLWSIIENHPTPREIYAQKLIDRKDVDAATLESVKTEYKNQLQGQLDQMRQTPLEYRYQEPEQVWRSLRFTMDDSDFQASPETGISRAEFDHLVHHLTNFPAGFTPLPQIGKLMQAKQKLVQDGILDWSLGELLAYSTILKSGNDVRFSGQDVKRGTFSHRHACPLDSSQHYEINRLDGISPDQGKFRIFNSLLSEYAVLGFEYGYALAHPDTLVIWEAQFGDFANGASTVVDQYLSAGESKWKRMNGLVMLLPHGYEGQGPEHSSARPERYLQQCAENNMTIANVTTAANLFHILRRQVMRPFRKPLIIMTPKSILRPPFCLSKFEDFLTGTRFQELIDDAQADAKKVKRLVVCTGKIYYDLLKKQETDGRADIALVRLEQLYPFPKKQFDALRKKYAKAQLVWAQEEPANMGGWSYLATNHSEYGWKLMSRPAAASPATGYTKKHNQEQEALVNAVFSL